VKLRHLLVLALSATLVAAAPASAKPKLKHKKQPPVSLKAIWGPNTIPGGTSAFPVYHRLGVDMLQVQLEWSRTAATRPANPTDPADPAYVWPANVETAYREARRYGIKLAIMVKSTPGWANGGETSNFAPSDTRDYTNFLVAATKRYKRVHHWMVWGEPSRSFNWKPLPLHAPEGAQLYARLLDASYATLKHRSRRNIVIGGMTFTVGEVYAPEWIRWMRLPNGKPPRLDWYGHNPYSTRKPDLRQKVYVPGVRDFSDVDTLRRDLKKTYKKRTPRIFLSEFGVPSDHQNPIFGFFVSQQEQASWLTAAYRIAHRHRWIAGLGWWTLIDGAPAVDSTNSGLLRADGSAKPSYFAYRRAR
jgi:hypothetical protein